CIKEKRQHRRRAGEWDASWSHLSKQDDYPAAGDCRRGSHRSGWDYVVLQQGPSSLDLSRDTLVLATRLLDPYIKAAGGRSALLMVWPESTRFEFFDDVRASYQLSAQEVQGLFLPAGEAWLGAWSEDSQLQLYGPDGYHPSELGTYLAALVVFEGITGHDAGTLPAEAIVAGQRLSVSPGRVRLLQRAAHAAVARFSARQLKRWLPQETIGPSPQ
ncbi:MAG: hypothetical protein H0X07_11550, partial [Gemmatimonadales bacterium]|nr:hypothetical protein [Gemmatimonadales bacterium]